MPVYDPQSPFFIGENPANYDWQNEARNQNALTQNYSLRISGATEKTNYYLGTGYFNQESVLKGNNLERYNIASNLNTQIGKYIKTGLNLKLTYQISDNNQRLNLTNAMAFMPFQPLFDANDIYGFNRPMDPYFEGNPDWTNTRLYGAGTKSNELAGMALNHNKFEIVRSMGQGFVAVEPLRGLIFKGSLSIDWAWQQRRGFEDVESNFYRVNGQDPSTLGSGASYGTYGLRTNRFINYQADFTVSYDKKFGEHTISAVAGIQEQYWKNFNEDIGTRNTTTKDLNRVGVGNDDWVEGFTGRQQKFWYGYVARAGYNYASRYYIDLSFRRDASNGFPSDKRWGNFYSAAEAWRISSESFMDGVTFIDDLKLRGGWGQAGNDEVVVGQYAYLSNTADVASYSFGSGGGNVLGIYNTGITVPGFPNTDLTWETVTTSYAGFDALLFKNHLSITMEFYNRRTDDILQFVQLPPTVGINDPAFNIGSLQNRGIDLDMSYNGNIGELSYSVGGNISFVKNEVLELYNSQPLFTGYGRVEEGRPIGHLWGYKVGGIYQSQDEIDQRSSVYTDETIADADFVAPGDMYFLDVYGNPTEEELYYSTTKDSLINDFDRTEIGNTIPGYIYGINISLNWKGFDATINFYGEGDVDKYNGTRATMESMSGYGNNFWPTVANRWTESNKSTSMPRAVAQDPARNGRYSDRFVESAAFFRLNNWQVGYSVPRTLLDKTHVFTRLRVYVSGQNNLYIHSWSGLDPINDSYPLPRTFSFGLNVGF